VDERRGAPERGTIRTLSEDCCSFISLIRHLYAMENQAAKMEIPIYNLGTGSGDGSGPQARWSIDKNGVLYGTTYFGSSSTDNGAQCGSSPPSVALRSRVAARTSMCGASLTGKEDQKSILGKRRFSNSIPKD
jgi:hypothetical protein